MISQQRYLKLLTITITLISQLSPQKCPFPQKGLFMSYNTLSKRDTLPNMFTQINSQIDRYNDSSYKQNQTVYNILNLHPQMYYNEHHQVQSFIEGFKVNVTLGDIQFAFRMDYRIEGGGLNKSGWARGRVLMDQDKYFVKNLISNQGILQWDPQQIADLTATHLLAIDHSEPLLTDYQRLNYQQIVNDNKGDKKLKSSILASFNSHYKTNLKTHLNSEHLASNSTFTYTYKNIQIDFVNSWRNFTLDKGLSVYYTFQIDNHTVSCGNTNITFPSNRGGLQEVFSIEQIKNTVQFALEKGLADMNIDKKWQVPAFQFYMGDLSNVFSAAYDYKPDDPFDLDCKWDQNASNINMYLHDVHDLYVTFGQVCIAHYNGKDLFSFKMDMSLVARIYAEDNTLNVTFVSVNKFNYIVTAIDPAFTTYSKQIGSSVISSVLAGLNGKQTFGSGFKIYDRRFPSSQLTDKFLIIFDPSER